MNVLVHILCGGACRVAALFLVLVLLTCFTTIVFYCPPLSLSLSLTLSLIVQDLVLGTGDYIHSLSTA